MQGSDRHSGDDRAGGKGIHYTPDVVILLLLFIH